MTGSGWEWNGFLYSETGIRGKRMGSASVFNYSEIGAREENEDSVGVEIYGKNMVAVLADGLGGQGDGKTASRLTVDNLILCGQDGDFPDADQIRTVFFNTNETIFRLCGGTSRMKSTAVYLCIHGTYAIWGHTGDSRLYHFYRIPDGNWELRHYTLDHSISQLAVYMGEITREEIPQHPGRNRLIHVLGGEETYCEIQEPVALEKGMHGFLLCTDGFWENIDENDICRQLLDSKSAREWVERMIRSIHKNGKIFQDNNSAIAILLEV